MSMRDMKIKNCPICCESIVSKYSLHLHCIQKHVGQFICCPICYEPFNCKRSNADFLVHSNLVHNRRMKTMNGIKAEDFAPFAKYRFDERMVRGSKCMVCLKCFCDRNSALRHYKSVHLAILYLCHRCPQTFSSVRYLRWHFHNRHEHEPSSRYNESHLGGFTLGEEETAADALLAVEVITRSRLTIRRANSSAGVGIRILDNPCQVAENYSNMEPLLNLTHRIEKGVVKLRPSVMNDHNQLVDLTA